MITVQETFSGPRYYNLTGNYFKLLSTVNPVDVALFDSANMPHTADQVEKGFYTRQTFDKLRITTGSNELVKFVVSDDESGYDTLITTFQQGTLLTNEGESTVGVAAATVLPALGSRKKVVFRSLPTNTGRIALGGAGVALATAAIVLNPGDIWIENDAAPALWAAISDVAAQALEKLTAA